MKFLPYDETVLKTSMDRSDLVKKLSENIGERQQFFSPTKNHNKSFNGILSDSGFNISRSIDYQNSFLPKITGQIIPTNTGCSVRLTFNLHTVVLVFMSIWMGVVTIACLGLTLHLLSGGDFSSSFIIPYAMFVFGALLTLLPFKYEVKKAKHILNQILTAK